MKNYLEYKGYRGSVSYSAEDKILYGEVLGIRDSISFEGESIDELERDFHFAIDDYLETCKELGRNPDKEFKGLFNVRISPELHKKAFFHAKENNMTLNELVSESIKEYLDMDESTYQGYVKLPDVSFIEQPKDLESSGNLVEFPLSAISAKFKVKDVEEM